MSEQQFQQISYRPEYYFYKIEADLNQGNIASMHLKGKYALGLITPENEVFKEEKFPYQPIVLSLETNPELAPAFDLISQALRARLQERLASATAQVD